METKRYESGAARLAEIDGEGGKRVIDSLREIAPDLGKYIIEFAFGDIYRREGLSLWERELITIVSLLTAGGCEPQLEVHINGALNVGMPPEKIVEAFLQCVPYTGFPRVLNGIVTAKKVFDSRNLSVKPQKSPEI
ncbi:Carboxymuconolactone decarboxylase family protein [Caprobacter fermentans]|uniref:Carboxymuconolactone decarboxylase family protein n=1 Tax=Caproicibacter fermentans TaxID=2576756 RepID=A0A6N8HZ06_9FIRM|nr:carboxymuconolactone decarboxylase family protein [Caproicibacter fermentans]MVB11002.1 Carboxymuconolactone decarboxylase family protein [Caproicibacter fermentans]OCN01703.1 carboxymuconolactone decarboxylase [Clostridium sp. W14A]QNK39383.1 carboxymuconolactone decarboxylase family protein [Caproicibacter fermentans]